MDFELVGPPTRRRTARSPWSLWRRPDGAAESSTRSTPRSPQRTPANATSHPTGTFQVNRHIIVDDVTIQGAATGGPSFAAIPWLSARRFGTVDPHRCRLLWANTPETAAAPTYTCPASRWRATFASESTATRSTGVEARSAIHHRRPVHPPHKSWSVLDGPMNNLTVANLIVVDTMADGLNFCSGVTNSQCDQLLLPQQRRRTAWPCGRAAPIAQPPCRREFRQRLRPHTIQTRCWATASPSTAARTTRSRQRPPPTNPRGQRPARGSALPRTPFPRAPGLHEQHHRPRRHLPDEMGLRARRDLVLRAGGIDGAVIEVTGDVTWTTRTTRSCSCRPAG